MYNAKQEDWTKDKFAMERLEYVRQVNQRYDIPEKLWKNTETITDLAYELRSGYVITKLYEDPETAESILPQMTDDESKIVLHHPESVLDHSARVGNTISEIVFDYPKLFNQYNQAAIIKVALNHDIGEATVHDIPDDGSKEHSDKAEEEAAAVEKFYANIMAEPIHSLLLSYHRQFEDVSTFLGQILKMADKSDAIARLILFERYGIKGNVYDKHDPSQQDRDFAAEVGTGNNTDVWARHLYWLFHEKFNFEPAVIKIAEDYLYYGTQAVGRPWFEFWPRT